MINSKGLLLNVQLKAIQDELGVSTNEQELKELYEKSKQKKWSDEVAELLKENLKITTHESSCC